MRRCPDRQVVESLVRATFIEEANVLLVDVIEMAQAEAEEVAESYPLERADPRFAERVRIGSQQGRSHAAVQGFPPDFSTNLEPWPGGGSYDFVVRYCPTRPGTHSASVDITADEICVVQVSGKCG